jgi:hypothetical protein
MNQPPDLGYHPGWHGAFTRSQAAGAIPNGTRIVKQNSETNDANPDGTLGTVLGSINVEKLKIPNPKGVRFAYFVEWDTSPKAAVGTLDFKIGPVQ